MVVGLGNPGKQYEGTRHNVGYEVLAEVAKRHGSGRPQVKHNAELIEFVFGGEKILLVSPLTYMNHSGRSVRPLVDFYKLPLEDLLVLSDDLSLPTGQLRIKAKGSSGGQKGIENIIQLLGTEEFPRLRVGIDPTPPRWSTPDYVLGKFSAEQRPLIDMAVRQAADAIETWVREGITVCMNRFNVRPEKAKKQKTKPAASGKQVENTDGPVSDSDTAAEGGKPDGGGSLR